MLDVDRHGPAALPRPLLDAVVPGHGPVEAGLSASTGSVRGRLAPGPGLPGSADLEDGDIIPWLTPGPPGLPGERGQARAGHTGLALAPVEAGTP